MNDFSVHRIIGRGGFGEVYGCRKADTGKMYAMKCLDKKRIKMKQGETLALNERIMLSLVSTGVSLRTSLNHLLFIISIAQLVIDNISYLIRCTIKYQCFTCLEDHEELIFNIFHTPISSCLLCIWVIILNIILKRVLGGLSIYCVYDIRIPYSW